MKINKPKIRVYVSCPNGGEISRETRRSLDALKSVGWAEVVVGAEGI